MTASTRGDLGSKAGPNRSTPRRVAIALAGTLVTLTGIAMLLLPGPALVVLPIGLAILALEFHWARRWLSKIKQLSRLLDDPQRQSEAGEPGTSPATPLESVRHESEGGTGGEREKSHNGG